MEEKKLEQFKATYAENITLGGPECHLPVQVFP